MERRGSVPVMTSKQQKIIEHLNKVHYCTLHSAMKVAGYMSGETGTYAYNWENKDWCDIWRDGGRWMIGLPGARDAGNRRVP